MSEQLYTIGHSNITADDFVALLKRHEITVLVDVRSAPYSRYAPHFSKHELESFIQQHGLTYRYAGDVLGGRPQHADVYKKGETPDANTRRDDFPELVQYEEVMKRDWYQTGIRRLLATIREAEGKVAIMCSEGNPLECHRHHLIARSLLDPRVKFMDDDLQVHHILKTGDLQTVTRDAFASSAPSVTQLSLWDL